MGFGARENQLLKKALPPTNHGTLGRGTHQPLEPMSSSVEGKRTDSGGMLDFKGGAVLGANRDSILICFLPLYIGSLVIIITLKGYGKEIVFMYSRPKQDYTSLNIGIFFPHALKKKISIK